MPRLMPAGDKLGPIALTMTRCRRWPELPRSGVYEKILSNIAEIKSRAGFINAVADGGRSA
jgi:hypothetical protein